ncbi:hypothetical protein Tco_0718035 [Tanacetum coccineum]
MATVGVVVAVGGVVAWWWQREMEVTRMGVRWDGDGCDEGGGEVCRLLARGGAAEVVTRWFWCWLRWGGRSGGSVMEDGDDGSGGDSRNLAGKLVGGALMSMERVFKTRLQRRGVKQSGEIDIDKGKFQKRSRSPSSPFFPDAITFSDGKPTSETLELNPEDVTARLEDLEVEVDTLHVDTEDKELLISELQDSLTAAENEIAILQVRVTDAEDRHAKDHEQIQKILARLGL